MRDSDSAMSELKIMSGLEASVLDVGCGNTPKGSVNIDLNVALWSLPLIYAIGKSSMLP